MQVNLEVYETVVFQQFELNLDECGNDLNTCSSHFVPVSVVADRKLSKNHCFDCHQLFLMEMVEKIIRVHA